jgi:N-acetylneuraminic acid mutarotase
MRLDLRLVSGLTVMTLACTSEQSPTDPAAAGVDVPASAPAALVSNTWTQRGPHRFGTVSGVSIGVLANSAGQSVVYGFGGCDPVNSSFGECAVSRVAIYNAATDAWTVEAGTISVFSSNGVGAIGGKLYISGGYTGIDAGDRLESRALWAYNPATHQSVRRADMPKFTAEGITGVIGDKLYVLPGNCDSNFWPQAGYCEREPIRRLYRYDPGTNKWGARKSAPHFHKGGAGGVIGGKFYVVGGLSGSLAVASLDVYDPATDTWTTRAAIPKAGRAIGTALGGKLYVVVGLDAYVYNPGTNRWNAIADPSLEHEGIVRVVIGGTPRLLAIGGSRGTELDPNNTEVYTP